MSADLAAIRRVIADIEAGFNAKDPELSVAHFARDGTAVGVDGTLVTGREALLEALRTAYAGALRDQHTRYELADVTFVRPDVAIAHIHARAITAAGEPLDVGHAMIALYVLVREDGRWLVATRQDTVVR